MSTGKESQHPKKSRKGGTWAECLLHLLRVGTLTGGVLAAWRQFVQLPATDSLILLAVLLLVLAAGLVLNRISVRAAQNFPWMLSAGAVLIAFFCRTERLFAGILGTANMGIAYWNQLQEDARPYLMDGAGSREGFFVLGLVLVFTVTALFWHLAWHKAIARALLISVLVLTPGILLKQSSIWGVILLFLGETGMWLYAVRAGSYRERFSWTIISTLILLALIGGIGNRDIRSILRFKEKTLKLTDQARFGEFTLPEGDLRKAYMLKQGDSVALRVTTDEERALYLRGYTAGRYEDGVWKPLRRSAYSGSRNGFLKWLEERKFDPNAQFALCQKLDSQETGEKAPESQLVRVQNLGTSRKYLYTLYSAEKPSGGKAAAKRDEGYRSHAFSGAASYEMRDYSQNVPGELNKLKDWMYEPETENESAYLEEEAVYRDFVYSEYTEVNEELAPLIEEIFHDGEETDPDDEGVYTITQKIRQKMEKQMVYGPNPTETAEEEDPLTPFLRGERVGNSAFFATAGVLAYRSFGIPARYVEGYLKERKNGADGAQTVNLAGRDGHAWVEVYMDGLGWVPIDVTPGYYYDTYALLHMTGLPQEVQKASVQEDQGGDVDSALELRGDVGRRREKTIQKIAVSMVISGVILLLIFLIGMFLTGGEIRGLYEDWQIERLLARSPKEDTAGLFGEWIAREMACLGIEMRVGWQCAKTEQELIDSLPEIETGEYVRVNELLEKWFYGGERLELDEIRVLYTFLRKIKTLLDKRRRLTRTTFWMRLARRWKKTKKKETAG